MPSRMQASCHGLPLSLLHIALAEPRIRLLMLSLQVVVELLVESAVYVAASFQAAAVAKEVIVHSMCSSPSTPPPRRTMSFDQM